MKKRNVLAMILMAVFLSAPVYFAQEKPAKTAPEVKPMPQRAGMMQNRSNMMGGLNLTAEQKEKIQQFNLDQQKDMIKINSEIQLNKVEIKKLFAEKELNTSKFQSLTEANGKLELQIQKMRTDNWVKIYSLLNDDQKAIWKKHFESAGMVKQGFRGQMMRRGAGQGFGRGMHQGMMQGKMGRGMMHQRIVQGQKMQGNMGQGQMHEKIVPGQKMQGKMGPGMMQNRMKPSESGKVQKDVTIEKK